MGFSHVSLYGNFSLRSVGDLLQLKWKSLCKKPEKKNQNCLSRILSKKMRKCVKDCIILKSDSVLLSYFDPAVS